MKFDTWRHLPRRTIWGVLAAGLAFACLVSVVLGLWVVETRRLYTEQAMETTRGLATTYKAYTEKLIHEIDLNLGVVASHVRQKGVLDEQVLRDAAPILENSLPHIPYVKGISIMDARGIVVHATQAVKASVRGVDASQRDFHAAHRGASGLDFHVGRLFKSLVNDEWRFTVSRRLQDTRGEFLGSVVAFVDVRELGREYARHLRDPAASVTLMYLDGSVMSRAPYLAEQIGKVLPSFARYQGNPPASNDFIIRSQVDQVRRLIAQRRLEQLPLLIAVTLLEDVALTRWRTTLPPLAVFWGLTLLAVAALCVFVLNQWGRRELALRALRESGQRFSLATQGSNDGFWDWDIVTGHDYFSDRFHALLGYAPGELRPHVDTWRGFVHPDDAPAVMAALRRHLEEREPYDVEMRMRTKPGEYRWFRARGQAVRDDAGHPLRMAGSIIDITEHRRAEDELRESEKRLRTVVESFPNGVLLVDAEGKIIWANRLLLDQFGYRAEELLGRQVEMLLPPQARGDHVGERRQYQAQAQPRPMGRDLLAQRKDGSTFPVEIGLQPLLLLEGQATLTTVTDISERKRAEERLRNTLREKEVLLREIYHRVKNNLQVVSGLLNMQAAGAGGEARAQLLESASRVKSMALVHEQLYQSGDLSRIELRNYCRLLLDSLRDLHADVAARVRLRSQVGELFLGIEKAIPLGLIINELVSNCYKHAYPGGLGGEVVLRINERADGMIELEVSDDGVGLPAGFEPARQTSLGARLIESLAGQLDGRFEFGSSSEGRGTRFVLRFMSDAPGREATS